MLKIEKGKFMQSLTPNLAVKDIKETVNYYKTLGFNLEVAVAEDRSFGIELKEEKHYVWAMIKRDSVEIMLQEKESLLEDVGTFFTEIGASATFYITVENLDRFYASIKNKVEIYKELETTWYGRQEFYVRDVNGYILGFASKG